MIEYLWYPERLLRVCISFGLAMRDGNHLLFSSLQLQLCSSSNAMYATQFCKKGTCWNLLERPSCTLYATLITHNKMCKFERPGNGKTGLGAQRLGLLKALLLCTGQMLGSTTGPTIPSNDTCYSAGKIGQSPIYLYVGVCT